MKLPRHQRSRTSFARTFERDHEQTIAAMDKGGHDIPNQTPDTPLRLSQVGIKRESVPIVIADPFGGVEPVHLSCAVDARVSLEATRRGIHVSRIGDLIARLTDRVYPSLLDYALELNRGLREAQQSSSGRVRVGGALTYLEEVSGVKKKRSLEHLNVSAEVTVDQGKERRTSGLGFSHITACPCVQETYRNSFSGTVDSLDRRRQKGRIPLITHTQRCQTEVRISNADSAPGLGQLLACIDAVVVRNQNTLPREFELLNVHRAHAEPQFLEDVLRDVMFAVYQLVRPTSIDGDIEIKSRSMESIHDFDMEGEVAFSLKALDRIFGSPNSPDGRHAAAGFEKVARRQKAGRKKPGLPSRTKRSPQAHSRRK